MEEPSNRTWFTSLVSVGPQGGHSDLVRRRARLVWGLVLLGLVVLLWVFSSVLTQALYGSATGYDKPTALTTFCCGMSSVFLLPGLFRRRCPCDAYADQHSQEHLLESVRMPLVFLLAANWFACQWSFNLALEQTALATNTLLSSSSTLWSYLIGILLGRAQLSWWGTVSVVAGMSGVAFAVSGQRTRLDPTAPQDTITGETLAIASAVCYGVFSNMLARHVKPEQMEHVWGCVGVACLAIGSVLMLICHIIGFEKVEPPSSQALGIMVVNALLGTAISDYLWAKAVLMTSPLLATVGLNMTIPVSYVTDSKILRQHEFSWTAPVAAVFVGMGVLAGAYEDFQRTAASDAIDGTSGSDASTSA